MPKNPNPQGKGVVPVLEAWQAAKPSLTRPKSQRQVLNDYAISLLVLSAQFQFNPLPQKDNLPSYVPRLSFYARILATGLSTSLNSSMAQSGLFKQSGQLWLESLSTSPEADRL